VSGCVYVSWCVCCLVTVGVLVFVASSMWLFLHDLTVLLFIEIKIRTFSRTQFYWCY